MPACLRLFIPCFLPWARWVLDSGEIRMTKVIKVLAFMQKIEINKQKLMKEQ